MRTWSPTHTTNGWFPKLSPDGRYIAYGFWETHLTDLTTGVETQLRPPLSIDGQSRRMNPIGWLNATTLIAVTELGPPQVLSIDVTTGRITDLNVPNYEGASFGNADAGSWGVYLATADGRNAYCTVNGQPFHPELQQYGCAVSGRHVLTADKSQNYEIMHFVDGTLMRRLPSDNKFRVNAHGDIVTGYYGTLKCYPFREGFVDATLTPWRREEPGAAVRVNGDLWLWTATDDDDAGRMLILGRRLGETMPIILWDFPSVHTDVVWNGEHFLVAGNSDKGALQVRWVSMDAAREPLPTRTVVPITPPVALPVPVQTTPLAIAITEWAPESGTAPVDVRATAQATADASIEWSTSATVDGPRQSVGTGPTLTMTLQTVGAVFLWATAVRGDQRVSTQRVRCITVSAKPETPTVPVVPTAPLTTPLPTPSPATVTSTSHRAWWIRLLWRVFGRWIR